MKARRMVTAAVVAFTLALSGCGGGTFLFTTGPNGSNFIVVSGTCTSVQTVNVVGNSGFILVTSVTLISNGMSSSFNFCGNVTGQFPLNSFLTIRFTNGPACAMPASIVIG
jgi:hypothetical protein